MPGTFDYKVSRPAFVHLMHSVFLVLMIFGPSWSVNSSAAAEPEIGQGISGPVRVTWDGPVANEIEIGLNWMVLADEDMNDTYGGLPVLQIRVSAQSGPNARFFLGTGYGQSGGNPYYDQLEFVWDRDAELKIVPIQMGFRVNLEPRDDFRLNAGILIEGVWVQETLPPPYLGYPEEVWQESGWIHSVGITFGPEWRSRDLSWAIGFEGGINGNSGTIGRAPSHDVNLSGMSGRIYFTTGIWKGGRP